MLNDYSERTRLEDDIQELIDIAECPFDYDGTEDTFAECDYCQEEGCRCEFAKNCWREYLCMLVEKKLNC